MSVQLKIVVVPAAIVLLTGENAYWIEKNYYLLSGREEWNVEM